MKRTALYPKHVALGAHMTPFSGYLMPVKYTGINREHLAVREAGGLFDVSHMGEFHITGPDALAFLQMVTINDVTTLEPGQAQYSAMCYSDGGLVDDLVLYRRNDKYLMVVNAANIETDFDWLQSNLKGDVVLENASDRIALIAAQGPRSRELVSQVLKTDLSELAFYHFKVDQAYSQEVMISRTGYTGELGYELYTDPDTSQHLWDDLLTAGHEMGIQPAGLGARDTLRLEMKYALYGNDITAETNPIEAGLGWITKLDKGSFIGARILAAMKAQGPSRRLVAFEMVGRAIPRKGYSIMVDDEVVGNVSSGTQSPSLNKGIGLGYVAVPHHKVGTRIEVDIRGRSSHAVIIKPPFVKYTSLME